MLPDEVTNTGSWVNCAKCHPYEHVCVVHDVEYEDGTGGPKSDGYKETLQTILNGDCSPPEAGSSNKRAISPVSSRRSSTESAATTSIVVVSRTSTNGLAEVDNETITPSELPPSSPVPSVQPGGVAKKTFRNQVQFEQYAIKQLQLSHPNAVVEKKRR